MRAVLVAVLLLAFPIPEGQAEEPAGRSELVDVSIRLRSAQIQVKGFSLRAMEIVLGPAGSVTTEEEASLQRVAERMTALGTVVSYEASRFQLLAFVAAEHQARFSRMLLQEIHATIEALSVDEGMVRERTRTWPESLVEQLGRPDELIGQVRTCLESALPVLKKLGGATI